ncbi:diaminobutyrate--2-oxoglutarate transaminase [Chengkuizengella marina]|uniref:Diaminobutyrate--2-oxoglutarate transaminase n=1 Tax=Chengkuizengella marina TaxID=2507566 RepID=A0A6N9Q5R8_9BACL|nr:diaminobutyrate--2-oxoglutarate transaminase [Chengkuizengella marina]NBI30071.1 diaminobutyrate--2-oxoglutarate transaminase [Chengkuizengella marina]
MNIFEKIESNVRSYCRNYPVVFDKAKGEILYAKTGESYIDFLAGAGALNYGHNHDYMKGKMIDYITSDKIMHGLDLYTSAKEDFISAFHEKILSPRQLNYKIQFSGPTGANAVEAALKLARKFKKRTGIFALMGSFHGMTLGSLSISSNKSNRAGAGLDLDGVTFIPFNHGPFGNMDTIKYMEYILNDTHSGIEKPAAMIIETVQAEGGVNVADIEWLRKLRKLCDEHDILLICDDIQVGCLRTGSFFSFERADIIPDIVVLSKSISGYGLPMSLVLIRPELDIWKPGEHNGTFRGNQLAFIAAKAALEIIEEEKLEEEVKRKEYFIKQFLEREIKPIDSSIDIRGIGMIWGIDLSGLKNNNITSGVIKDCFEHGLIIESAGRNDHVIKILPPLTIGIENLNEGCNILKQSLLKAIKNANETSNTSFSTNII